MRPGVAINGHAVTFRVYISVTLFFWREVIFEELP
jgi:hypothetical protein